MSTAPATSTPSVSVVPDGPDDANRLEVAIIDMESDGNDRAISPSGGHFGLFQMGHARAKDVGIQDASALLGNPELQRWAFWTSLGQTVKDHQWVPDFVAVSWHDGNGSLRKAKRLMRERGLTLMQAIGEVTPPSWHSQRYLKGFRRAYAKAGK